MGYKKPNPLTPFSPDNAKIVREPMERLQAGNTYFTRYVDRYGNETERVIDVLVMNGRYVEAYCHLKRDIL
ncbi:MAG: hypothetical protein KAU14_01805 [Thermoplasmata archaeon]|nr:hypothetical protein [Thermoplasmata archaeon]